MLRTKIRHFNNHSFRFSGYNMTAEGLYNSHRLIIISPSIVSETITGAHYRGTVVRPHGEVLKRPRR
uniref:Uncharacterized protein n=1 Tax=Rhizophora mucronata TaxID=61149 RepID=A0A2P2MXT1_RHIMU